MAVDPLVLRTQRFSDYYIDLRWGNEPEPGTPCGNRDCDAPVHGRHLVATVWNYEDEDHFCSLACYRAWEYHVEIELQILEIYAGYERMRFRGAKKRDIEAYGSTEGRKVNEWIAKNEPRFLKLQAEDAAVDENYRRTAVNHGQTFDNLAVFARDNFICHICGYEVRMKDTHPKPLAPVLDHVHPLVKGGTHTWDSVACAHSYCNAVKGDRLVTERMREKCRNRVHELLSLRKVSARNTA